MKYAVFILSLLGCFPLAFLASSNARLRRLLLGALPLAMILWDGTAINFFSQESYRGTARGMEVSLLYLVAFALLLARVFAGRPIRLFFPGFWTYLLYFGASLLSFWASSCDHALAWYELWKMLMLALVFVAVANEVYDHGDVWPLLLGLAAVVWVSLVMCLWQRYALGVYQVRGVFPHQNSMSMFMTLLCPVFLAGWLNLRSPMEAWVMGSALMAAGLCILMGLSRGALVCLPIACLMVFPTVFFGGWSLHKTTVCAVIAAGGMLALALFLPRVIERFETAPEASGKARVELAEIAVDMVRRHPMGVGLNNWGLRVNDEEYQARRTHGRRDPSYRDGIVETVYLLVGAECGIPGFAALLLLFGWVFLLAVRTAIVYARTSYGFLPAGITAGLVAVYLQSVLEWVLKQAINFTAYMILFAILSALWSMRDRIARTTA